MKFKELMENMLNEELKVDSNKFRTKIYKGSSWSAILMSNDLEKIKGLKIGNKYNFKDEQGHKWDIIKNSNTEYSLKGISEKQHKGIFILKEGDSSGEIIDDIYDNKYKKIEISLRYSKLAADIYEDSFSQSAKKNSTNSYKFKNCDMLAAFVEELINNGISENELEFSK